MITATRVSPRIKSGRFNSPDSDSRGLLPRSRWFRKTGERSLCGSMAIIFWLVTTPANRAVERPGASPREGRAFESGVIGLAPAPTQAAAWYALQKVGQNPAGLGCRSRSSLAVSATSRFAPSADTQSRQAKTIQTPDATFSHATGCCASVSELWG